MQTTIFDFTFKLRDRAREIYIARTSQIIMRQDFRLILVGNHPKSFSIRAAIVEEGVSQEQVTDFFLRKGSPYVGGIGGPNDSLFGLSQEDGFNYQPLILIRRTTYPGVIIGRLISKRGFISTDKLYILRNSVLKRGMAPKSIITYNKHKNYVPFIFEISRHASKMSSLERDNNMPSMSVKGRLERIKKTVFHRLIGTRTKEIVYFVERVDIDSFRSSPLLLHAEYPQSEFNRFKSESFIELAIIDGLRIIHGVRHKYAIISLEKNVQNFKALRSRPSRHIVKG
jgi:hypothetical protein